MTESSLIDAGKRHAEGLLVGNGGENGWLHLSDPEEAHPMAAS